MKPTPIFLPDAPPVLADGAHPDDNESGCGGVIAQETRAGLAAHVLVWSVGDASTDGRPEQRVADASRAATLLGATVEYAAALVPADPLEFTSLAGPVRGVRGV